MFKENSDLKNEVREKCGLFAGTNLANAAYTAYYGLHALQHRGQDGCGIVVLNRKNKLQIHKSLGLVRDVFTNDVMRKLRGWASIGHTRYATTGDQGMKNIQPFYFNHKKIEFALAHNGNISNAPDLRLQLENRGSVFFGTSDTELFGHYLIKNREPQESLFDSLLKNLNLFEGAFSLVLIDKHGIYAVRDKWGFRPLVIGKNGNSYFFTSETCGLDILDAEYVREVLPGEVVFISHADLKMKSQFYTQKIPQQQLCAMELIYFARPDSVVEGINIHQFRKECGKELANLFSVEADIVVPVPDSSVSAALGFAEQSQIPYELGLIKNRYVARTFIEPSQSERKLSVSKKLTVNKAIIANRNIILIDDSIVRGTTITQIIAMMRKAGALSIHVRVASPKIIAPSYYGINISTYKELIACGDKSEKELAKIIGADSLAYLPIDKLEKIAKPVGLDLCIFTDKYQTKVSKSILKKALK